jgi:hypothetical protein
MYFDISRAQSALDHLLSAKGSSVCLHVVYSDEVRYSNADWAGDVDSRRFTTGYIVL